MSKSAYYTKKLLIEVQFENAVVRMINRRKNSKAYYINKTNFYRLIKSGENQIIVDSEGRYMTLSCNISNLPGGKHLYSDHNIINTYIPLRVYESLIYDLEMSYRRIERADIGENHEYR